VEWIYKYQHLLGFSVTPKEGETTKTPQRNPASLRRGGDHSLNHVDHSNITKRMRHLQLCCSPWS